MVKAKKVKRGLLNRVSGITGKIDKTPKSLKPQQARQLIRRFHTLQKTRSSVLAKLCSEEAQIKVSSEYKRAFSEFLLNKKSGNTALHVTGSEAELSTLLGQIDSEIEQRGGLNAYQVASTQGQTGDRGGDSSKKLIEWLRSDVYSPKIKAKVNALEIGSLSTTNYISTCKIFSEITRIDLNSQHSLIMEQDFMKRPLPKSNDEKFNLISCSLVVNFVPSPKERGEMLYRLTQFLKPSSESLSTLFFVIPLPCTNNSRYCNKDHLLEIMQSLGFTLTCYHESTKLSYWLFDWNGVVKRKTFQKKELKVGNNLNNFCVTMG